VPGFKKKSVGILCKVMWALEPSVVTLLLNWPVKQNPYRKSVLHPARQGPDSIIWTTLDPLNT
jgi:hypothetical protein